MNWPWTNIYAQYAIHNIITIIDWQDIMIGRNGFSPFINPIFMSMGEGWKKIKKLSQMWKILLEAQIRDLGEEALNIKIQLIAYSVQDNNQLLVTINKKEHLHRE